MTNFDTLPRAMAGEDAKAAIAAFAASDIGPWTPLRAMAADYATNGAGGFGELESILTVATLCAVVEEQDRRIKALEGREDRP